MENNDTSCEPMDVDLSINSANDSTTEQLPTMITQSSDESSKYCEILNLRKLKDAASQPDVWNVKKYHIIRKTQKSKISSQLVIVALLVLPLAVVLLYFITDLRCSNDFDLKKLKLKLTNRLHGQALATESLIEALSMDHHSKILFFYGGTGVGKTFTSTLIFEDVWNSSNVYHYTMPSFGNAFSTETMLGLNICDNSFVVIDDLRHNDFLVKEQVADVIKKSANLNRKITVILIYNCDIIARDFVKKCDNTFHSELSQAYEDVKVYKKIIEFKPLTQEVLRLCVEDELGDKSVNDLHFDSILNNFNVELDGCKGVHKKIKFLNFL